MGRRRGSNINSSSLDLFLDTICNAFGGIMFISILISVLAQMKGGNSQTPSDQSVPQVTREQAIESARRSEQLETERRKIAALVRELERSQLNDSQLAKMLDALEQMQKQLDQIVSQQAQTNQQLTKIQTEVAKIQEETDEVERKARETKAALDDRSKGLDDQLNAAVSKVQILNAHATSKGNFLIGLRFGKVYLISDVTAPKSNTFNLAHVEKIVENNAVRIRPRPDAGTAWSRDAAEPFSQSISTLSPNDYFLTVAVWPDSFDTFGEFKEHIVRMGYEFELVPLADVASIPIGRSSSPVVQ